MWTHGRRVSRAFALAIALYVTSLIAPTTYRLGGEWPLDTGLALVNLAVVLLTSHGILAGLFPVLANALLVIGLWQGAHARASATGCLAAGLACAVVSILVLMFYVALLGESPLRLLASPAMGLWLAAYVVGLYAVTGREPAISEAGLPSAVLLGPAASRR